MYYYISRTSSPVARAREFWDAPNNEAGGEKEGGGGLAKENDKTELIIGTQARSIMSQRRRKEHM